MAQQASHTIDPALELRRHATTYHRFTLAVKWVAIHLAVILGFLIVAFATPGGIFGGLVVAAVILAVGIYAMTHGLQHSTESDNPPEP